MQLCFVKFAQLYSIIVIHSWKAIYNTQIFSKQFISEMLGLNRSDNFTKVQLHYWVDYWSVSKYKILGNKHKNTLIAIWIEESLMLDLLFFYIERTSSFNWCLVDFSKFLWNTSISVFEHHTYKGLTFVQWPLGGCTTLKRSICNSKVFQPQRSIFEMPNNIIPEVYNAQSVWCIYNIIGLSDT